MVQKEKKPTKQNRLKPRLRSSDDGSREDMGLAELPVSSSGHRSPIAKALSSEFTLDDETLPLTHGLSSHSQPHRSHPGELTPSASASSSTHHPHHHAIILPHNHHHGHAHAHAASHTHAEGVHKCGVYKTLGNIFISFVGAGVLALPYAFAQSGMLLGSVFMVVVALLALYCILLLVDCKRALESRGVATYSEVTEACLGRWGKLAVEVLLVLSQTGFCIAYLVFIASNLSPLTHLAKASIVMLVLPFEVLLAMLQDLSALAPFSLLADAAIVVGMLVVVDDDILAFKAHNSVVLSKGLGALPFLFGVVIYCYEGIGMILPLEDSMKDKTKFKGTLTTGFALITAVFVLFGAVGYAAFGDFTDGIITTNLPDGLSTSAVKVSLCVGLFFTFPVMMVPVYEIADRTLAAAPWFEKNFAPFQQEIAKKVGRACTILTLGFIASSVPSFAVFISFIGSFACALLAFIIPALCHIILFRPHMSWLAMALDGFMIAFGTVGMVFGVTDVVRKL